MDAKQFDSVAKVVGQGMARRRLLAGLFGASLAGSLGRATVTAKGKQRHRVTAQDDTPKLNGKKCTKNAQCGSNCCRGESSKQRVCQEPDCAGQACGANNGCGGKCQTGSCSNATLTCHQGTCCTEGNCTGAGQCCGSLHCIIDYSSSTGYCDDTCLPRQSKCDGDAGGCCGTLSCQLAPFNQYLCL
jgi:hypothetical protein